jgi:transcription initiation factor IIE alpha subunit
MGKVEFNPYKKFIGIFIPEWVFHLDVTHTAMLVYGYLAKCSGDKGKCFPSIEHIAEVIQTNKRSVHRAIDELKNKELIGSERRKGRAGLTCEYVFYFHEYMNKYMLEKEKNILISNNDINGSSGSDKAGSSHIKGKEERERKRLNLGRIEQARSASSPTSVGVSAHSLTLPSQDLIKLANPRARAHEAQLMSPVPGSGFSFYFGKIMESWKLPKKSLEWFDLNYEAVFHDPSLNVVSDKAEYLSTVEEALNRVFGPFVRHATQVEVFTLMVLAFLIRHKNCTKQKTISTEYLETRYVASSKIAYFFCADALSAALFLQTGKYIAFSSKGSKNGSEQLLHNIYNELAMQGIGWVQIVDELESMFDSDETWATKSTVSMADIRRVVDARLELSRNR